METELIAEESGAEIEDILSGGLFRIEAAVITIDDNDSDADDNEKSNEIQVE